ncbi:hypothetical protein CTAYLR_000191 [Chrysophaeum taylorii]|uniref:Uncharacterized protein n=1 Tax=Chrysophaeum taylorii TaxID=2483200 RepID=A0AAD7UGF1_9STRA|nr:hypothetical protein CTAYLR_000191 [Chrysophaeum taylorii]
MQEASGDREGSVLSPRSVATKKVDGEFPQGATCSSPAAMECENADACGLAPASKEMPSFLPSLVIEVLGYPAALASMVACQAWRSHGERIFRSELRELRSACECKAEYLGLPATTKSTISIAFSPDQRRFASTHGDHTVKVVDFATSRVVATLRGHPRTPWTVKFHPFEPDIVASGCLGFEARIWRVSTERCASRTEFDRAIISLSFHPSGEFLAIAAGTYIYLWQYATGAPPQREFSHPHPIRCLRFLPSAAGAIIVGAANGLPVDARMQHRDADPTLQPADQQRQRATFQLMVCDFDLEAARRGALVGTPTSPARPPRAAPRNDDPPVLAPVVGAGRAISTEPRCVLRHALFYNDGGFDVAPCGTFLCSCAELWLPRDDDDDDDEDDDEDDDDADDDVVRAFSVAARPTTPSRAPPVREPPTSQASRWFAATTTSTPRRAPSTRGASPPAFGERRPAASWWRGPRDDASRRSQRRPRAVRVDVESVAPTGLCGAIMQPLFADDADDERPTRRARSVSSLDDAADERGTISSSESETTSPRRRRRVDAAPRELGVSALASLPARLTPGEQRRLRQQLVVQDQIQFSDSPLFSRRPSLPTPRRDDSPPPPWNLDSPLDSAASSDDGQPSRRRAPRSARRPRRLAALTAAPASPAVPGKYTPHLVVVSLVETTRNLVTGELEGKLLQATALDDHSFSGAGGESAGSDIVTSVKLSPTASLVLLGHSRGGDGTAGDGIPRVVSVIYRVGDMARINTRKEVGDDVNIARFHPVSGAGIVYGTKQGRICKITPARSHHHPA